jgi:hypothetical protein
MGNHTNIHATNRNGGQVSLSHTSSDSPILPAPNLEHLQKIDPSLVPWVIKQTEVEADFRRTETRRINRFVFIERLSGVIVGGIVALAGLLISSYVAVHGQPAVAMVLGGATLVAIVTVLVVRKTDDKKDEPAQRQTSKKTKG